MYKNKKQVVNMRMGRKSLSWKGWFATVCFFLVIFISLSVKETSLDIIFKASVIIMLFLISTGLFLYYALTDQALSKTKKIKKQLP